MTDDTIIAALNRQAVMPAADVVGFIDSNPDEAARAIQLARASGVAAPVIAGDLPHFEAQFKTQLAGNIVRDNSIIRAYIEANPMASRVSNDDYGNLDQASQTLSMLQYPRDLLSTTRSMIPSPGAIAEAGVVGAFHGLIEGFGPGGEGAWISEEDRLNYPIASAIATKLALPVEFTLRSLSAVMKGTAAGARGLAEESYFQGAKTFGAGERDVAKQFGRDIGAMTEMLLNPGHGAHKPGGPKPLPKPEFDAAVMDAHVASALNTWNKIGVWLESEKEPPRGIDPIVDQIKVKRNEVELQSLDQAVAEAQISATRERDPDMYAAFARQAIGERKIGISGDAIVALYGDKLPEPGDAILGWVPDIAEQLEAARLTGQDILIPMADWVAKVDPAVAKALHDDTRVRGENLTAREGTLLLPSDPLPGPIAQVRAASALEPMFSIGDRKLTLTRNAQQSKTGAYSLAEGFHDFELVDETGRAVGYINLSEQEGGKKLYVEMISGVRGHGPRSFGPTLMISILKQLKAEFPNAERIGGFRVTGARDAVGKIGEVEIKLDIPEGWDITSLPDWYRILEGGEWMDLSPSSKAYVKADHLRSAEDRAMIEAVFDELDRIVPREVGVQPADRIIAKNVEGQGNREVQPSGTYIRYQEAYPIISFALEGPDPIATARHEAIHHLRQYGFFTEAEWKILSEAAAKEDWAKRYNIDERYPAADGALRLEESIADAFKDWMANKDSVANQTRRAVFGESAIDRVFTKLAKFLEKIKTRLGEILGREPTWEDIFRKVDEGEIGSREGNKPLDERSFQERLSVEEGADPAKLRQEMIKAEALGLPLDTYRRLSKLIQKRHAEDIDAATKRLEKEERKRQTKEWKAEVEALRPEVVADIKARPDVAVDLFLSSGEVQGSKIGDSFRLRTDDLSPAAQEALPKWYQAKQGLPVEEVANLFGFPTKEAFEAKMIEYTQARGKVNAEAYRRQLVDAEINRRVEAKLGNLEDNIIDAARDQVLSETQIDILAEEMHAVGLKAQQAPITREAAKAWTEEQFAKMRTKDVSVDSFTHQMLKHGKEAEALLIKGDFVGALHFMERRFLNTLLAQQARALDKEKAALDKTARPFLRAEPPKIEEGFAEHISRLLAYAGYKVRRNTEEIQRQLDFHENADLGAFVQRLDSDGWEPEVAPWIDREIAQRGQNMTVEEFRDFKTAIDSLNFIGRKINQIELEGERLTFAEFRKRVVDNITQLPARGRDESLRTIKKFLYGIDAGLTRMENIVRDLDLREELGPLWDAVIRPLVLSKKDEFDLMTELSNHFKATRAEFGKAWRKSLGDAVEQDVIWDPGLTTPGPMKMTRENVINVMLNWGNLSNRAKLTQGAALARFGRRLTKEELPIYEQMIFQMVDKVARKEDWEFVQRLWEPFKGWKPKMEAVARATSGKAPKWVEETPVMTRHGTFEGGYWPLRYDRDASDIDLIKQDKPGDDGVFGPRYERLGTGQSHLKSRTGYAGFVDIETSIEQAVGAMQQTIHDIAFREGLIQATKVFKDKEIMMAIRRHYGPEYADQMIPWLKRISLQYSADDVANKGLNRVLRWTRSNLVSHALPFNLNVILSPAVGSLKNAIKTTTGMILSPVAPDVFARFDANRKENMALALEKSHEIRHAVFNMDRDYAEIMNRTMQDQLYADTKRKLIEIGYKLPMVFEQQYRVATFVDRYHKALSEGKTETEAILIADTAVRENHGAASIVDLPANFASNEAMKMLTIFQGYFNNAYNKQREIPGNIRRGEYKEAFESFGATTIVGAAFGAALFMNRKEDDNWFKIIAKALVAQPLSMVPMLGPAANYFFEGFAPRMPFAGLVTAAGATWNDVIKAVQGKRVEKPVLHAANVIGLSTGLPLGQMGKTAEFAYSVAVQGDQRPRDFLEYLRGIRTGEARLKK